MNAFNLNKIQYK